MLREGTEYGLEDYSLEQKIAQVLTQLQTSEAMLMYSELNESVDIVTHQQYENMQVEQ